MKIRTRLLLGYGYIVMLLLLTATSAALGFYQISEAIERILSENYQSVAAAVSMLESLEQQNNTSLALLLLEEEPNDQFARAEFTFERSLMQAMDNVTLEGEGDILDSIRASYESYRTVRLQVLETSPQSPLSVYNQRIFPVYTQTRGRVFDLMSINHQAIIEADEQARITALQVAGWLGVLVTIALVSIAYLARVMQNQILSKLFEIIDAAENIWAGDHTRRFNLSGNDELGIVARHLNSAMDKQEELQGQMRGRLNQQKQLVLGLMEYLPQNGILVGLDGNIIAMTSEPDSPARVSKVTKWLIEQRKTLLKDFRDNEHDQRHEIIIDGDHIANADLLISDNRRTVGWFVTFVSKEEEPSNVS